MCKSDQKKTLRSILNKELNKISQNRKQDKLREMKAILH